MKPNNPFRNDNRDSENRNSANNNAAEERMRQILASLIRSVPRDDAGDDAEPVAVEEMMRRLQIDTTISPPRVPRNSLLPANWESLSPNERLVSVLDAALTHVLVDLNDADGTQSDTTMDETIDDGANGIQEEDSNRQEATGELDSNPDGDTDGNNGDGLREEDNDSEPDHAT